MTGTSQDEVVQAWVRLVSAGLRSRPLGTCRGQGRTLSLHSCVPVPESLFASPERVPEPPTEGPSSPTSPAGQMQGLVIGVTSILVGVLLLLLLTWALATAFPRAMRGNVLASPPPSPWGRAQGNAHSLIHQSLPPLPSSEDPCREGVDWPS